MRASAGSSRGLAAGLPSTPPALPQTEEAAKAAEPDPRSRSSGCTAAVTDTASGSSAAELPFPGLDPVSSSL